MRTTSALVDGLKLVLRRDDSDVVVEVVVAGTDVVIGAGEVDVQVHDAGLADAHVCLRVRPEGVVCAEPASSEAEVWLEGHRLDAGATVTVSGSYTGAGNDQFVFTPRTDGDIGTTAGLLVDVYDVDGNLVNTLDVGEGYLPGTELEVAEGVSVSFGFGTLSATENDAFSVDLVSDSDTADVLVALGIGGLFTGTGAEDLGVSEALLADPSLLNASTSGLSGDAGAILELLGLQYGGAESSGGGGLEAAFSNIVTELGFETQSAMSARDVEEYVVASLDQRRAELSGVNVDEELVEMMRFEQSFAAASRYISVINELNDSLLALI